MEAVADLGFLEVAEEIVDLDQRLRLVLGQADIAIEPRVTDKIEDAAAQVLSGLKKIGFNHKPNIERANFAVLRTSDMPAMLVETAFISNVEEERRLNDPAYRRQLAAAILDGIDTYFERQPPPGTLYAARAKAEQQRAEGAAPARNTAPAPALLQPQPVVTATAPASTTGGSP